MTRRRAFAALASLLAAPLALARGSSRPVARMVLAVDEVLIARLKPNDPRCGIAAQRSWERTGRWFRATLTWVDIAPSDPLPDWFPAKIRFRRVDATPARVSGAAS